MWTKVLYILSFGSSTSLQTQSAMGETNSAESTGLNSCNVWFGLWTAAGMHPAGYPLVLHWALSIPRDRCPRFPHMQYYFCALLVFLLWKTPKTNLVTIFVRSKCFLHFFFSPYTDRHPARLLSLLFPISAKLTRRPGYIKCSLLPI